jgi:uncharacterized membrane protein
MVIVTTLGLAGTAVSAYVWYKQVTPGPVLCLGDGCAKVIRSPYGRLLGLPNGALGVGYFTAAALIPLVVRGVPVLWTILLAASAVALVLYAYLAYLQFAVIRAWCVWCLSSAALSAGILAATLLTRG